MARALALLALLLAVPASAHAASISGTVFNDYDANGVRAPSEPPLAGIAVSVAGATATTSAQDGSWSIDGLGPGTHRVVWTPPEDGVCTTIGCAVEVPADTTGVDLGVQLGALLIDPGDAVAIGRARLIAPRGGCRRAAFPVAVEGNGIARVDYRVDGRRVAGSRRRGFRARIAVARLAPGRHTLVAVLRYGTRPSSPTKRLTLAFRRCP